MSLKDVTKLPEKMGPKARRFLGPLGQVLPAPKVKVARRPERKRWPGDLEKLAAIPLKPC